MNNKVIAITGPTGSGKSTVAEKLAKKFDRCVNIDADHIKHMIVSGFYKDDTNPGGWSYNQWGLVGDSIGLLTQNFLKEGYSVVINGYIDEPAWTNIQNHVAISLKVLLLPDLETATQRDAVRSDDIKMGGKAVQEHHSHFSNDTYFHDFIRLDTTTHSEDETVEKIINLTANLNEESL
jgi:predicted kinase